MQLTLCYRHEHHAPRPGLSGADIEAVAHSVRGKLGADARAALTLEDLGRIEALCVNDVAFEVWSDLSRTLHDPEGEKVPGIFEFLPEIEDDAVNVRVSPVDQTYTPETVLSTFAHELGHAIFDGPALIAHRATQRAYGCREPVRAYRIFEQRLTADAPQPALHQAPDACETSRLRPRLRERTAFTVALRTEWRANHFMGCLLVPHERLLEAIAELGPVHDFALDFTHCSAEPCVGAHLPRIVCRRNDVETCLDGLTVHLAYAFGVTPWFIRRRLKRCGLLEDPRNDLAGPRAPYSARQSQRTLNA